MYPTLFKIFGFRIDTYSVVWFLALSLAIIWAIKRLRLYKIDEDEARNVMSISFLFMLFGAHAPEYFINWKSYMNNPALFLDFNRGGLHEIGAILGAFISAFVLCFFRRKKISFLQLCEACSIPIFLSIAVGRWGCFLNGCCVGLPSKVFCAVHFPKDPAGLTRHPVQIYYSIFSLGCIFILMSVEKFISRSHQLYKSHSILTPLTLILYSLMRFSFFSVRNSGSFLKIINNYSLYKILLFSLPLEILWLIYGLRRLRSVKNL